MIHSNLMKDIQQGLRIIMLVSVGIAIYSLIIYLYNFNNNIKKYKPFWKFFSIKLALFLSIWQTVILKLCKFDEFLPLIAEKNGKTLKLHTLTFVENLLIVIEMFVLSIFLIRIYSWKEFLNVDINSTNSLLSIPKIM